MAAKFVSLLAAIVDDDRAAVRKALASDPELSSCSSTKDRLEAKFVHWIYRGDTALHVAAAGYRVEIAKLLLTAGSDVGASQNRRRAQSLHYAADGHLESSTWNPKRQAAMIRLLLAAGAKIDAQDKNGATPLHRAVRTRCAAAVQCFLDAGADPTLRNQAGSTPFHLAVQNTGRGGSGAEAALAAQRKIVRAFLAHGVSPTIVDAQGKSVATWAKSEWIRQLLMGGGA